MLAFKQILGALAFEGSCGDPRKYSGRLMYGRDCVAVELDWRAGHANPTQLGAAIMRTAVDFSANLDDVIDVLGETSTDHMGLNIVVYWPSVPFEG